MITRFLLQQMIYQIVLVFELYSIEIELMKEIDL